MPTWLRCEDEHGNQFDLAPEDKRVKDGVVKVLEDYPENSGLTAVARDAKVRVSKAAKPKVPASGSAGGQPTGRDVGQPEKE